MLAALRKIRPLRGWRAFSGEVGVIVLGVLIAVGIGKAVEALDWRDRVAAARKALNEDIAENILFAAQERIAATPCLLRQLDRLHALLLDERPNAPRAKATISQINQSTVYIHPIRSWSMATWTSVVSDNIPAHMPADQRITYETVYTFMPLMDALNTAEDDGANDLLLLSEPIPLDRSARLDLLRAIMRQRGRVAMLNLMSHQVTNRIRELGVGVKLLPEDRAQMKTVVWCRAHNLL